MTDDHPADHIAADAVERLLGQALPDWQRRIVDQLHTLGDEFSVTLRPPRRPPPVLSIDQLRDIFEEFEARRQRAVVTSDQGAVADELRRLGFEVHENRYVPDGQVVILPSRAEMDRRLTGNLLADHPPLVPRGGSTVPETR